MMGALAAPRRRAATLRRTIAVPPGGRRPAPPPATVPPPVSCYRQHRAATVTAARFHHHRHPPARSGAQWRIRDFIEEVANMEFEPRTPEILEGSYRVRSVSWFNRWNVLFWSPEDQGRHRRGGGGSGDPDPRTFENREVRPPRFENEVAKIRCFFRFLWYFGVGWPPCRRFDPPHSKIRGDAPAEDPLMTKRSFSWALTHGPLPLDPSLPAPDTAVMSQTPVRHVRDTSCVTGRCCAAAGRLPTPPGPTETAVTLRVRRYSDPVYMSRKNRKFRTDKFDTWNKQKFWLIQLMKTAGNQPFTWVESVKISVCFTCRIYPFETLNFSAHIYGVSEVTEAAIWSDLLRRGVWFDFPTA